jgi:hypothetical protein
VGIRNFSPHFRNSEILRTTESIAGLRTKKSCGTAIADLQNCTSAILQLSVSVDIFSLSVCLSQLFRKVNENLTLSTVNALSFLKS